MGLTLKHAPDRSSPRARWLAPVAFTLLVLLGALVVAGEIVIRRAGPILKSRIEETLTARFGTRVELDDLHVALLRGLEVSGAGLRVAAPNTPGGARPLLSVRAFRFHTGLTGLFVKPMHVGSVEVSGLEIHIPPRSASTPTSNPHPSPRKTRVEIVVDTFEIADSLLVIDNADPSREPKTFQLNHIHLADIAPGQPLHFDATLTNPLPTGLIQATGTFGPWPTPHSTPADTPVAGHYVFSHADLNSIKGIGGILSSTGDFHGVLDRILVEGTTDTPDFSLDTAHQPMPLQTSFRAIVDGTTGDTYLQPVHARLRNSAFTCTGSVVNLRGKGHVIDLDVDIPEANLQDFLALAVRSRPVLLTARISTRAHLHIRPGHEPVPRKLAVTGAFSLRNVHFSNPQFQDRIDEFSERAQGHPAQAVPGAPDVRSSMGGRFALASEHVQLSGIDYTFPGATIHLDGVYSLDGEQLDLKGVVQTEAKASQMVKTWWKQLLLHAVDKYLSHGTSGTEIPFTVHGTRSAPKFGFDFDEWKRERATRSPASPQPPASHP